MRINRSMPDATIIPELVYADVEAAVLWLCNAFGFTERLRIGNHRSQLCFGDGSVIVVGRPAGQAADLSEVTKSLPPHGREIGHAVMVRVENVDGHYERAKRHGAAKRHNQRDVSR